HSRDFFADIADRNTPITIELTHAHFDEPVHLKRSTFLMHKFWDADQVDRLTNFYINLHNYALSTDIWRDTAIFFPNVFTDFPVPNYRLGELTTLGRVDIEGDQTDVVSLHFTVPYHSLRHYEEQGQVVPPGLPAPFGFLEPFHFHFEFIVGHDGP